MNTKRLVLSCIAVFLCIFACNFVLHGILLKDAYANTAELWRTESEMNGHFGWLLLGQLLQSVMFCVIYALRCAERTGVGPGAGYGLLVALLLGSGSFITYAVQPIPMRIPAAWFLGGIVELTIAGAILGGIYRPAKLTTYTAQPAAA